LGAFVEQLEGVAPSGIPPMASQAIRDFICAVSYNDGALIESRAVPLLEELRGLVVRVISIELEKSKETLAGVRNFWRDHLDGVPHEDFEPPRKAIEAVVDERIAAMTGLRDEIIAPFNQKTKNPIENSKDLEDGIRELRKFKERLFQDW